MRGRFITLEGGEGVGKSTQARRLLTALAAHGHHAVITREPGGTEGAEAIRALLMSGAADRWSARVEALLFSAARADHVERLIRPALENGQWVICDRFLDSTLAYQGGASGIGVDALRTLHAIGSEGLMPDRTLLLTLAPDQAAARLSVRDAGGRDRMGARDEAYYERVNAAFLNLAAEDPGRFRVIDAGGAPDAVEHRLIAALGDWM